MSGEGGQIVLLGGTICPGEGDNLSPLYKKASKKASKKADQIAGGSACGGTICPLARGFPVKPKVRDKCLVSYTFLCDLAVPVSTRVRMAYDHFGAKKNDGWVGVSNHRVAQMIGTSVETLTKVRRRLTSNGLLEQRFVQFQKENGELGRQYQYRNVPAPDDERTQKCLEAIGTLTKSEVVHPNRYEEARAAADQIDWDKVPDLNLWGDILTSGVVDTYPAVFDPTIPETRIWWGKTFPYLLTKCTWLSGYREEEKPIAACFVLFGRLRGLDSKNPPGLMRRILEGEAKKGVNTLLKALRDQTVWAALLNESTSGPTLREKLLEAVGK